MPAPRDALSFVNAAIPEPFQILGLRLKPFTLGHYITLKRFGCAFVSDEKTEAEKGDLLLGCLVCSMNNREFLEFLEAEDHEAKVVEWGEKCGAFNFAEKCQLFADYLAASFHEPSFSVIGDQQGDTSGDWSQNLKLAMMLKLNASEEAVLNTPLSSLMSDYFRLAEMDGLIRIESEGDAAAADANAKILEAALKGELCPD